MARQKQLERITVHTKLYAKGDLPLLQEIWDMQAEKKYTGYYRLAFHLLISLKKKDTRLLFETFPWLLDGPINHTQLNYINYLIERVQELEEEIAVKGTR